MNRPGPVGIALLLAFSLVVVIELRTVLGAVGVDIATGPYFVAAAGVLVLAVLALVMLPETETPTNPV